MRNLKIKQIINTDELDWNNPNCLDNRYLEYLVKMYNERITVICRLHHGEYKSLYGKQYKN